LLGTLSEHDWQAVMNAGATAPQGDWLTTTIRRSGLRAVNEPGNVLPPWDLVSC
jgi:hypothetical protein